MYKYYVLLFFTFSFVSASDHGYSLLEDFDSILVSTLPSHLKRPETAAIKKSLLDVMSSLEDTQAQLLVIISLESPKSKNIKRFPVICHNTRRGLSFLGEELTKNISDAQFPKKDPLTYSFVIAK